MRILVMWVKIIFLLIISSCCTYAQEKTAESTGLISEGEITKSLVSKNSFSPAYPTSVKFEYAVQVGAFEKKINALKLRAVLSHAGYQVDVYENYIDGKKLLYLVWVGNFTTVGDADSISKEITAEQKIKGVLRVRSATMHQTLRPIALNDKHE